MPQLKNLPLVIENLILEYKGHMEHMDRLKILNKHFKQVVEKCANHWEYESKMHFYDVEEEYREFCDRKSGTIMDFFCNSSRCKMKRKYGLKFCSWCAKYSYKCNKNNRCPKCVDKKC